VNNTNFHIDSGLYRSPHRMLVVKSIQSELYIQLKEIFILARITNIYSDKMNIAFANIRV